MLRDAESMYIPYARERDQTVVSVIQVHVQLKCCDGTTNPRIHHQLCNDIMPEVTLKKRTVVIYIQS